MKMEMVEKHVKKLEDDLLNTRNRLEMLCGWIKSKFGNDPSLPKEIFLVHEYENLDFIPVNRKVSHTNSNYEWVIDDYDDDEDDRDQDDDRDLNPAASRVETILLEDPDSNVIEILQAEGVGVRATKNKNNRKRHLPVRTSNSEKEIKIQGCWSKALQSRKSKDSHPCLCCGKILYSRQRMKQHVLQYHPEQYEKATGKKLSTPCPDCDKVFDGPFSLTIHQSKVHPETYGRMTGKRRNVKCLRCDKYFYTTSAQRLHMASCHSGSSPVQLLSSSSSTRVSKRRRR